ncbi:MAG: hypothetical protein SGJ27_13170 [Candidatus Melainabacteria bacterium]|nr:hypothetical protein [Candidatus Melainabacteria bacterium]
MTRFDIEKATQMVIVLRQFLEVLRQDWQSVSIQWRNLEMTWHDKNRPHFEAVYQKLNADYAATETEVEHYIEFLLHQIRIAETASGLMNNLNP